MGLNLTYLHFVLQEVIAAHEEVDWEHLDIEMISLNGQIIATRHLMSVAKGMIE